MKVQLRGHNFELTEANKQYAIDKVSKLERFFDNEEIAGNVTVKKFQRSIKVEVMISGSNRLRIRAEEVKDDFYAAVDIVIEKLEKQIRKHKTKIQKHHQVKMVSSDYFEEEEKLNIHNTTLDKDKKINSGEIVREKEVEITKPMSLEEAILQFEMLGHNFYVYKDQDTMNVNVLYKRDNGNYGLIKTV